MSAMTDVPMLTSGVANNECMWRNISRYHRSRTNKSELPDGHSAENHRACTDRCAIFDQSRCDLPISGSLEFPIRSNSTWEKVICKANMRANKDAIFKGHTFKDRDMVLEFYT